MPLAAALRDALAGADLDGLQHPALSRILPELGLNEEASRFADIDALEALVDLIADQAPIVLLLDDLQWADRATIATLSYLHRRCTSVPVALAAAIGSEQTLPDHPARRLKPDVLTRLEPLTAAELAPLGIAHLHESTDGNPRFVAQAIATGDRSALASALKETLLDQCRAEGAQAHRVLLAASVAEQPFEPEPIAALLHVDTTALVEDLERLCEHRILRVDGPRFRFRYRLVRDVVRDSLSPARARPHRRSEPGRLRVARLHARRAPRLDRLAHPPRGDGAAARVPPSRPPGRASVDDQVHVPH